MLIEDERDIKKYQIKREVANESMMTVTSGSVKNDPMSAEIIRKKELK